MMNWKQVLKSKSDITNFSFLSFLIANLIILYSDVDNNLSIYIITFMLFLICGVMILDVMIKD